MASETTGISFDKVFIVSTQDTDLTPFDTGAYASRQTYVSGMACKKCATELRHRILDYAAYMLNHDVTDLSKTVYADLVKEAAGKLREALGLHPEDEVKEDMLDIVDSKIDPVPHRDFPEVPDPRVHSSSDRSKQHSQPIDRSFTLIYL